MQARFSTGLKQALLGGDNFRDALAGGFIHIYAYDGASVIPGPDDAVDTAADYTLLATISASGGTDATGLLFDAPSGGVIFKADAQTWSNSDGGNIAGGQAVFYVYSLAHDGTALGASTSDVRIVGPVAMVPGGQGTLVVANSTLVFEQTLEITFFNATVGA